MEKSKDYPFSMKATYNLLFIILLIYALIVAKDFLIIIGLGVLFSYMIFPFSYFLETKKFPRALATAIAILSMITVFTGILFLIYWQVSKMIGDFPQLKSQALLNVDQMEMFIESNFGIDASKQHRWLKESVNNLFESGSEFSKNIFSGASSTMFKMFVLPVFIFYLLQYRDKFLKFMLATVSREKKPVSIIILKQISSVIQNYMSGIFVVIMILSVLYTLGLYIIGFQYALTFGIIAALFNFIPYFGSWLGASIPITFALLTAASPVVAIYVLIMFVIVIFIEHNILTPNITGVYINLNPLFTIFGIIVGGMIWGIAGMLIVLPTMATIKIICDNNEKLTHYGKLLGHQSNFVHKNFFTMIKDLIHKTQIEL
ncbi:MAG: AI-2E family transporter [Bacteroidales bacterium]|nr:AI-2E family transporter [Bacteroidales bacterium]